MDSEESASAENQTAYEVSSLVEQLSTIETTNSSNQFNQNQSKSEYSPDFDVDEYDPSSTSVKELDHWSKWLLRKEMEQRGRKLKENAQKQQESVELNKTHEEKQLKIKIATENWKSQLLLRIKEHKARNEKFENQLKDEKASKEKEKLEIQQRCSNEYRRWLSKKTQDIKENKLRLQRELEELKINCERKKQVNSEGYEKWLLKSIAKPLPERRSYGISAGKLISWKS